MVAIIKRRVLLNRLTGDDAVSFLVSLAGAGAVFGLAQRSGWWPLALALVLGMEIWWRGRERPADGDRRALWLALVPLVVTGWSVALIVALVPRLLTQVLVVMVYAAWRWWWLKARDESLMAGLLVVQMTMFEALFLMGAIWRTPEWIVMGLAWLGAYGPVYAVLERRGERAAAVMAAAWGLIVAEVSWVLLMWLFTYATPGGYVLVPQPALVLVALAYCFGSIYVSAKQGSLSRARLVEYLVIALILIVMVITGTSWKGAM